MLYSQQIPDNDKSGAGRKGHTTAHVLSAAADKKGAENDKKGENILDRPTKKVLDGDIRGVYKHF